MNSVLLGLNWSVAQVEAYGLCFSPTNAPRTLDWSGTLVGRSAIELAPWIRSLDASTATVGALVVNAVVNHPGNALLESAKPLSSNQPPHLAVFEHFKSAVQGARVVVVGRYPGLERVWSPDQYVCLERRPLPGTVPESNAEQVLRGADWVFVTASSIVNKTLPSLLRQARGAQIVLMGPSLPWLSELADFGVSYLAGVAVTDGGELMTIAAQAGGTRIFERAVEYRLLRLA